MAYISERKISFLVEKFMLSARLESQIIQIHKSTSNLKETVAQANEIHALDGLSLSIEE